jgi:two-component system sensor histidine kinase TctE
VSGAKGEIMSGDADLPELPGNGANPVRGDASFRGEPIRLVSYRTLAGPALVTVTVGETLHKRDAARAAVLTTAVAVDAAELALLLALIWLGVRLSLAPLRHVASQIYRRSARDLAPLPLTRVPIEIRGVVEALNRLFATVTRSSAEQRRFLESAAHQLRTPLTGIQAQLELLAGDATEPQHAERLRSVLDAARRLAHTAQQLLALARADEAVTLDRKFEDVDLARVVESAIGDRVAAADAAGIDLGAEIEATTVRGVPWLIAEALANLLDNALNYTPADGRVTVRCERGSSPNLQVMDTGPGIPPCDRERVVDRFFRGGNARGDGSGLGLAIVREVAQLHGATLSIDAGPDGRGTLVTLRFPDPHSESGA